MRIKSSHLIAASGAIGLVLVILGAVVAVNSNHGTAGSLDPGLTESSRRELERLPYCVVSRRYGVSPEVLAGVVLAEKQLNRDWTDRLQDGVFTVLLALRSERGWQEWAHEALARADRSIKERARSRSWPSDVVWTGVIFSLGPAQITPRTAFHACRNATAPPDWCATPRRLIEALMDETRSLEVAALVLVDERKRHLAETQVDVGGRPGQWATLYNFGGEIFRTRFRDQPDRPANGFGRWIDHHSAFIASALHCNQGG